MCLKIRNEEDIIQKYRWDSGKARCTEAFYDVGVCLTHDPRIQKLVCDRAWGTQELSVKGVAIPLGGIVLSNIVYIDAVVDSTCLHSSTPVKNITGDTNLHTN